MAFLKGVNTTRLFFNPVITLFSPLIIDSTAFTPNLLASTLSKHDGEPPLCICPKTETRAS